MDIINLPSPNYFTDGLPIRAIVLHGTAGPLKPSIDWLRNPRPDSPGSAVSANYVISIAGQVYQLVDWRVGRRAYANGIRRGWDKSIRWLNEGASRKVNPNLVTLSIEHEASNVAMLTRGYMSDAQFNASTELVITLLRETGLPIDKETVNGHYQIDGMGKANCPGVINIPAYIEVLKLRKDWYK